MLLRRPVVFYYWCVVGRAIHCILKFTCPTVDDIARRVDNHGDLFWWVKCHASSNNRWIEASQWAGWFHKMGRASSTTEPLACWQKPVCGRQEDLFAFLLRSNFCVQFFGLYSVKNCSCVFPSAKSQSSFSPSVFGFLFSPSSFLTWPRMKSFFSLNPSSS